MTNTSYSGGRDVIVVNQYFTATEAAARPEAQARIRMLVVAPDPLGKPLSPLNIAAEWTALTALIQRSDYPVALVRLNPPTFEHLQEAVADLRHPYDVIHFIAHGDGKNLALEKADGGVDWRTYDEIRECLARGLAQVFVFGVCLSLPLAEALERDLSQDQTTDRRSPANYAGTSQQTAVGSHRSAVVGQPAIIAAPRLVEDDLANEFARGLYSGLFGGQPAAEAFGMGERLIREQGAFVFRGEAAATLREVPDGAGPLLFPGDPPHNAWLPGYSPGGFVGREDELREDFYSIFRPGADLAALFVTGIGGIGKTTLATAAARRYGWRFPGGIVSVSAKDLPSFGLSQVIAAIDSALGTEAGKRPDPISAALAALNDGPHLLILDNLETIDSPEARRELAGFVRRIEAGPGSRAVLTMRPRALDELTEMPYRELRVGPLGRAEAVALLKDRAQPDGLRRMDGREAELAHAAHYHPMLLAFAAGRLHLAPLDVVLNWLGDLRGDRLDAEIPQRLGAMVADVAQAAPEAPRVLCTLAVFSGGATHAAAVAVHGGEQAMVDKALVELVKGNLAELDPATDRFTLQSLVAQWARQHGPYSPEEWRAAGRRHAEHFLALAQEHWEEYRVLEPELDNLRTAFAFVTAGVTRDGELTRALVRTMHFFLDKRGHWDEDIRWWQEYGEASRRLGDRAGLAASHNNIGAIHYARGDYPAALEWYEKSVAIKEELGDRAGLAASYNNIGAIHHARGDYPAALEWFEKSLAIQEELGDRAGLAQTLHNMGYVALAENDLPRALALSTRSREVYEEIGLEKDVAREEEMIEEVRRRMGDNLSADE